MRKITQILSISMSPDQLRECQETAAAMGTSVSDWIRRLTSKDAELFRSIMRARDEALAEFLPIQAAIDAAAEEFVERFTREHPELAPKPDVS